MNFCTEAEKYINEMVHLNDIQNSETYEFTKDGFQWRIYKTIIGENFIEMNIRKMNYSPNNIKEQPKGNRIYERSFCYINDVNRNCIRKWNNHIIGNLFFDDYNINIK